MTSAELALNPIKILIGGKGKRLDLNPGTIFIVGDRGGWVKD